MTGIEQLKKKLESDSEFAKALENAADKDALLQKIKDAGIDVTLEEIAASVSGEGELDDSALAAAAGGYQTEADSAYLAKMEKVLKGKKKYKV